MGKAMPKFFCYTSTQGVAFNLRHFDGKAPRKWVSTRDHSQCNRVIGSKAHVHVHCKKSQSLFGEWFVINYKL